VLKNINVGWNYLTKFSQRHGVKVMLIFVNATLTTLTLKSELSCGLNDRPFYESGEVVNLSQLWNFLPNYFEIMFKKHFYKTIVWVIHVHCVPKKAFPTFSTITWNQLSDFDNFFGMTISFLMQLAIKWPFSFLPYPTFVFALPGGKHNQRNITFLSNVTWLLN